MNRIQLFLKNGNQVFGELVTTPQFMPEGFLIFSIKNEDVTTTVIQSKDEISQVVITRLSLSSKGDNKEEETQVLDVS